jgi:hypothetical protein
MHSKSHFLQPSFVASCKQPQAFFLACFPSSISFVSSSHLLDMKLLAYTVAAAADDDDDPGILYSQEMMMMMMMTMLSFHNQCNNHPVIHSGEETQSSGGNPHPQSFNVTPHIQNKTVMKMKKKDKKRGKKNHSDDNYDRNPRRIRNDVCNPRLQVNLLYVDTQSHHLQSSFSYSFRV